MPISETQLETWSRQGSITQSSQTYASIRTALEDRLSSYADKSCDIFLQGSYGNDTNVYADSDVDTVIKLNSTYYSDVSSLSSEDLASYNAAFAPANYEWTNFKAQVTEQLTKKFAGKVIPGKKAVFIKGDGVRRDADVVAAAQFRRYLQFKGAWNQRYIEGITFWANDGTQIINYPKLHSENCTRKHQATNQWFKPMVRILKNARNSMISQAYLDEGIAPSYFLEGLLYNVPNSLFGRTYVDTFMNTINWCINTADRSQWVCANEQYFLCHPTSPVTWRAENLQKFLDATANFWASY